MKLIEISPSILNVVDENLESFLDILQEINTLENENITYIHLDIMDNIFVNASGVKITKADLINKKGFVSDIHLMVDSPKAQIEEALKYSPGCITIHFEAKEFPENLKYLNKLRESKKYSYFDIGVSLKEETDLKMLLEYKEMFDVLLLMSVEPGYGNQKFKETVYDKIVDAKILFSDKIIQVDGGINDTNIQKLKNLGVDKVVVGSYLASNSDFESIKKAFEKLRKG